MVFLYLYWVILHSRFYLNYYLDRKNLLLQTLDPFLATFREFPETTNELAYGKQSEEATGTVDQMSIDDSPSEAMCENYLPSQLKSSVIKGIFFIK